jgi:hypothetical protein
MTLQWRISHPRRLVLAVAKGGMAPSELLALVAAIDGENARGYSKIVDIRGLSILLQAERLQTLAHIARMREAASIVGALALVASPGPAMEQAEVFADSGRLVRPIRVFVEHRAARRWIASLADRPQADAISARS